MLNKNSFSPVPKYLEQKCRPRLTVVLALPTPKAWKRGAIPWTERSRRAVQAQDAICRPAAASIVGEAAAAGGNLNADARKG